MKPRSGLSDVCSRDVPPDIGVCVPIWRAHATPNISDLAASLPRAVNGLSAELVVVLNGVRPSDVPFPDWARVAHLHENHGVPIGWNRAAAAARASVLCFTNDDVVFGPGSLRRLWQVVMERPEAGIVGPVGTHWDLEAARHLGYVPMDGMAPGDLAECDVLSGFLLCLRREVFDAAGGFDEALTPCGFEEVDLCTTVRRQLGLQCLAVAGVEVQHEFGISARRGWSRVRYLGKSESLRSIARRNRRYFISKWSGSEKLR